MTDASEVARALVAAGDEKAAWERALAHACAATRAAAAVLWARDGDVLRPVASAIVAAAGALAPQRIEAGAAGVEKEALRTGRTLHVAAAAKHPLADAAAKARGDAALVAVPLFDRGEGVGVLALHGPADAASGERLGPLFALALRNAALRGDVAERVRRLEDEVRARTRDLDLRATEMQEFLSGVGHDLRAPLVAVAGLADAVEEDLADPAAARQGLARVRANVDVMEALVDDLLELARLGRAPPVATEVALGPVVARVAAAYRPRFEEAGGRVHVEGPFPVVVGDAARLERAVRNLVDNALKYRSPTRPPVLRVLGAGREVRFEDDGRGFPPAFAERLFRPFQRHAPEAGPGTGLGLVLVKRIVEANGGRIDAKAEEGKGAVFRLRF